MKQLYTVILQDGLDTVVYNDVAAESARDAFHVACVAYAGDEIDAYDDYGCVAVYEGSHSNLYRDVM